MLSRLIHRQQHFIYEENRNEDKVGGSIECDPIDLAIDLDLMTTQWLTRNFIAIGIVVVFISLDLLNVDFSNPKIFTPSTFVVIAWLMLPYLVWAFINELRPDTFSKHLRTYIGFAIAIPTIGLSTVGYTLMFNDAQNAFLILEIPLMQFFCLGVAWAVCKK